MGIRVARFKMGITALSAALTALGGALLALYLAYANPDTMSGIGVSLRIVFAVVLGGMYALLGPFVLGRVAPSISSGLFGNGSDPTDSTKIVLGFVYWLGLLLLMFVSGSEDHIMPPAVQQSNKRHYSSTATTEIWEYEGYAHLLPAQEGWERIADEVLAWAVEHAR